MEASYNANMPFKWNATRIQVLPNQNNAPRPGPNGNLGNQTTASVTSTSTLNAHAFTNATSGPPPPMAHPPQRNNHQARNEAAFGTGPPPQNPMNNQRDQRNDNNRGGGRNTSPIREKVKVRGFGSGSNPGLNSERRREDRSITRDRDRDNARARSRDKEKERSSSMSSPMTVTNSGASRKRSRSPRRTRSRSRSRSPPRRRIRTAPRYNVSVPRISLNFPESAVHELKKRYNNMYIPSDFFMADHKWMTSFPMHDEFKIQYASTFHIFNKELVESPLLSDAVYDPTDADHSFNAKVMLLAMPPPEVLVEKTCQLAESSKSKLTNSYPHFFQDLDQLQVLQIETIWYIPQEPFNF